MGDGCDELGIRRVDEVRWLEAEIIGTRAGEEVYGV